MHNRSLKSAATILATFVATIVAHADFAQAQDYRVQDVMVAVDDSVRLATRVYLPQEDGRYPAVLLRSPYGAENTAWLAEYLAPHGYAVVMQAVRGLNGSEGQFFPFAYEKADGMATLEWLLNQPFCNGDVGLWGVSYLGFAANEVASTGHPAVKAMFLLSAWSDLGPFISHGGSFHLMAHLPWFIMFAGGESPPAEAWPHIYRATPIAQFFQGADLMEQMFEEPYDYAHFTMPIMHVTGWYDYIYTNTLGTYESITGQVPDAAEQRLIVGVWPHNNALNGQTNAGDEDFGADAAWGIEKVNEITKRWFDLHLKGIDGGLGSEAPVQLFVMGSNDWRDFDSWPPAAVKWQPWYVDCAERANGSAGTGTLTTSMTHERDSDQFIFDPNDPVPTRGGANWHLIKGNQGVLDQSELESRQDVLVYTSDPLASALTLVGPVQATVYAASEGRNTDFTAKLVEVRSDGYARNIVDGIVRASHLFGLDSTNSLEPGKVYKYDIDMGATAIRLDSGSQLRLEISSSNFPKYDRNPNTGVDPIVATEFLPVTQTVYHTEEYPTHVLLPVLEAPARSER
jgi:predicted acyl esterase